MTDPAVARSFLPCFKGKRIVVVGDVMLDEYIEGDANRLSPEAPVPVVLVRDRHYQLGGAGNVAHNFLALGATCQLFCVVGTDLAGDVVRHVAPDALGGALMTREAWSTPHKARVVARGQQIVRIDREVTGQVLDRPDRQMLLDLIEPELMRANALVLSDYGKGLLTPKLIHQLMAAAQRYSVPVFVDPKKIARTYAGASLIKPNAEEALAITEGSQSLAGAAHSIRLRAGLLTDVVITQGAKGCLVQSPHGDPVEVPTKPQPVADVQGAGDTAMAALTLARVSGAGLETSAMIANAAAGVVVSKPGTATATLEEVALALREGEQHGEH